MPTKHRLTRAVPFCRPEMVSGVLRKPFEVAELGDLVRACVTGFSEEVTQKLFFSKDRAIRDFVRGGDDRGDS